MIKKKEIIEEVPIEVGKTYQTKICASWFFTVTRIIQETRTFKGKTLLGAIKGFEGIYVESPHLGVCPIGPDRLIQEKIKLSGTIDVCSNCGAELEFIEDRFEKSSRLIKEYSIEVAKRLKYF